MKVDPADIKEGRFDRQLAVTGFSLAMQNQLESAKVLIIGAGGLGHPVVSYLAAAGVQWITLMDPDHVQISNLSRQIFFCQDDIGLPKVHVLSNKINALRSLKVVRPVQAKLTEQNAKEWISTHDLVLDCSDNLALKYSLSEACKKLSKPVIIGAVDQWQGQIVVIPNADSAGFEDFFPPASAGCEWGNCATNGVVGTVVGMVGTWMANEAMKIILGLEEVSGNRMAIFDGLTGELFYIRRSDKHSTKSPKTELTFGTPVMKSIPYAEFLKWREDGKVFQLIDVREPYEFDEFNLGGELIPMNTVPDHVEAFSREIPVVVHCKAGARSANVIRFLEEQFGFTNLYNLEGGVLAAHD